MSTGLTKGLRLAIPAPGTRVVVRDVEWVVRQVDVTPDGRSQFGVRRHLRTRAGAGGRFPEPAGARDRGARPGSDRGKRRELVVPSGAERRAHPRGTLGCDGSGGAPAAVEEAKEWLDGRRQEFEAEIDEKLNRELEVLEEVRERRIRQLERKLERGRRRPGFKAHQRSSGERGNIARPTST